MPSLLLLLVFLTLLPPVALLRREGGHGHVDDRGVGGHLPRGGRVRHEAAGAAGRAVAAAAVAGGAARQDRARERQQAEREAAQHLDREQHLARVLAVQVWEEKK